MLERLLQHVRDTNANVRTTAIKVNRRRRHHFIFELEREHACQCESDAAFISWRSQRLSVPFLKKRSLRPLNSNSRHALSPSIVIQLVESGCFALVRHGMKANERETTALDELDDDQSERTKGRARGRECMAGV